MKATLGLRLGQSLAMTPALQQAIRLLQLSSLDLQQEIQQALDSNVMLELEEEDGPAPDDDAAAEPDAPAEAEAAAADIRLDASAPIPEDMPVDAEWSDVYDSAPAASGSGGDEDGRDFLQANLHAGTSLHEHLTWQAQLAPLDPVEAEIALHLIDSIDDEGYLQGWDELCERLAHLPGADAGQVERVLRLVQDFDPPGVGARSLEECLRLQLLQLPESTCGRTAALELVRAHLPLLARRDEVAIARVLRLGPEDAHDALLLVQSLQPHPGRPFQRHEDGYVAPDVFVQKRNGRWRVFLNPEHAPRLRVNGYYQGLIRRADTSRDQLTLKNHLQEARYFINALESRNETLLRVAQCIVEEQRAFLEYGEEAMRPLVLRDVSEQLGIHESTVSRATANKYLHTPRGLFELKYFFSSHVATTQGGIASATAIQAMIKRLIAAEDPDRPLSDSTLSERLLKDGIQVARRTVAKYREGLGIPPSHERKPPG